MTLSSRTMQKLSNLMTLLSRIMQKLFNFMTLLFLIDVNWRLFFLSTIWLKLCQASSQGTGFPFNLNLRVSESQVFNKCVARMIGWIVIIARSCCSPNWMKVPVVENLMTFRNGKMKFNDFSHVTYSNLMTFNNQDLKFNDFWPLPLSLWKTISLN